MRATRPAIGPNLLAKYDYELRALAGCGLSAADMDLIVNVVGNYVHGALAESDQDGNPDRTFEFGLELLIDGISLYVGA